MCIHGLHRVRKVQEGPNKEYNVSSKGTNKLTELNNTWDSYVSSLPLGIFV